MTNKQTAAVATEAHAAREPRKNGAVAPEPEQGSAPGAPMEEPLEAAPEIVEVREPAEQVSVKRRMPENLRKYLLRMQGGKFYLPAAYRIVWFRDECPDWGVSTSLIEGGHEAGFATVQATIYNAEGRIIASGLKTESKQDFPAGWCEKAETGAIARALAVAGFGTQFSPELDDDANRPADSPLARPTAYAAHSVVNEPGRQAAARPATEVWEGPGQCPRCHAPEGKRHGKPCIGS